ncbi:MAG: ABC transporter permease [Eubacterium sp.]|nr:ABC transporter permease [Eubacterium sp.]
MKKKMSINTLALGNLRQRKKQYAIMIVGIILAMVFSSGILFYLFSSQETLKEIKKNEIGVQHAIVSVADCDESVFSKAVEDGVFDNYGLAHLIAYGYSNEEEDYFGGEIAWLDDKAKELSYQSFIEGEYPAADGEIAIEQNALIKMGYANAKVGDIISLYVRVQNGNALLDAVKRDYTLVGIVTDKRSNLSNSYRNGSLDTLYPAAYVAQNTPTAAGGREKLCGYISLDKYDYQRISKIYDYLKSKELDPDINNVNINNYIFSPITSNNSFYAVVLALALMVSSCVVIINSFNTNLKERKKQIGMLRAVGATKRQIVHIFAREALIIALICTPVSIALSYGAVSAAMKILKLDMIMTKSFWVLPISAVTGVIVVMLAALIPLASASRITPMQAIRDISATRKMKIKGIKTKKEFNVSTLMAQRNLLFFKGGRIAVSIMLSVTVLFSCAGFSFLSEYNSNSFTRSYDYCLNNIGSYAYDIVNFSGENTGMSEVDKKDLEMIPYITEVVGTKDVATCMEIDEYTDYYKSFTHANDNVFKYTNTDDEPITYDNYYDTHLKEFNEAYYDLKNSLQLEKDFFSTKIVAVDSLVIEDIKNSEINGNINISKLDSGEEIILIAPQKAAAALEIFGENGEGGYSRSTVIENQETDQKIICSGELNYKAGDTVTLDTITVDSTDEWYRNTENFSNNQRQVTIGAVISPSDIQENSLSAVTGWHDGFYILTTIQGMNHFYDNAKYNEVHLNCGTEITDEIDEQITEAIQIYADKYEGWAHSSYAEAKDREQQQMVLTVSLVALMTIIFAICGSIVNNSLTARIRENKKSIGTLRAFGADSSELVKSYIKQLVSMFSWGMISGFVVYLIIYIVNSPLQKKYITNREFFMNFNPWVTIIFCVVLFSVCSINLWVKIKAETKNSIIDNIREL